MRKKSSFHVDIDDRNIQKGRLFVLMDQAMFRRVPMANKFKARVRRNCQISSTLPLLEHGDLAPFPAQRCSDEREETAVLVPFKISGSWRAGSSFRLRRSHDSESRRSFSFLADWEVEEELSDESSTDFEGVATKKDAGIHCGIEERSEHAAANSNGNDEGKEIMYRECHGDQNLVTLRSENRRENVEINHGDTHAQIIDDASTDNALVPSRICKNQTDSILLLRYQSNSSSASRFAEDDTLQGLSSIKPSKSCEQQSNKEKQDMRQFTQHAAHNAANICKHSQPELCPSVHRTKHNLKENPHTNSPSFAKIPVNNSQRNTKDRACSDHDATTSLERHQRPHKRHGKGDHTDRLSKEGCTDASMHTQAAETKVKPKPNREMSPPHLTGTSLLSPRSPLRWRTVISLTPLNPSHVPKSTQWEMPASRSQSQRSRSSSSSGGSSGREGLMTPATRKDVFHLQSRYRSRKAGAGGAQKMTKTRTGYWALNPMQWLQHCRKEMQVVDMTTKLDSKENVPKQNNRFERIGAKS